MGFSRLTNILEENFGIVLVSEYMISQSEVLGPVDGKDRCEVIKS